MNITSSDEGCVFVHYQHFTPENKPFQKETSSSNRPFSGAMLVSGMVQPQKLMAATPQLVFCRCVSFSKDARFQPFIFLGVYSTYFC